MSIDMAVTMRWEGRAIIVGYWALYNSANEDGLLPIGTKFFLLAWWCRFKGVPNGFRRLLFDHNQLRTLNVNTVTAIPYEWEDS